MFSQNNSTKISKPHVPNTLPIVLYIYYWCTNLIKISHIFKTLMNSILNTDAKNNPKQILAKISTLYENNIIWGKRFIPKL